MKIGILSKLIIMVIWKRGLAALLSLSLLCLMSVVWLFLAVQRVCLQFMIVVFLDHSHHLLFFTRPIVTGPLLTYTK